MKTCDPQAAVSASMLAARRAAKALGLLLVVGGVVGSAIMAKKATHAPALVDVQMVALPDLSEPQGGPVEESTEIIEADVAPVAAAPGDVAEGTLSPELAKLASDPSVRWFNGRAAKPARIITMTVTAYSPDAKSCGEYADGLTATLHSVETNNFHLVAADPTLLPYGSMLSIPGYADGQVVPVLDCGGAIKGDHIDLLFPTDKQAREWGVKHLRVTVWRYVDGKGIENPRKVR